MTLAEVVLPLRLTNPQQDLQGMLVEWIQNNHRYNDAQDCLEDLQCMTKWRRLMAQHISSKQSHQDALCIRTTLHQYYHCLLECERQQIGLDDSPQRTLTLEWESAMMVELQVGHSIPWERTNLLWNLATLEAYQAYQQHHHQQHHQQEQQPPKDKTGWEEASKRLQQAASWLHQLSSITTNTTSKPFPFLDFYPSLIRLWKGLLLAESQRCMFESLACASRPNHRLLANVATAAVSMYSSLQSILQQGEHTTTTPIFNQPLIKEWGDLTLALMVYMKCMAACHLAVDAREREGYGEELALLQVAYREASNCIQACHNSMVPSLQELHASVSSTMTEIENRIELAKSENTQQHHETVPQEEDLPKIEGETLAKVLPLEQILEPYQGKPLFGNLKPFSAVAPTSRKESPIKITNTDTQNLTKCIEMFRSNMDQLIVQMTTESEERRELERQALAAVKLPHSLTAYRQELEGGGIPNDLWIRVEALQREHRVEQLKRELWELRDASEVARTTYHQAKSQLDLDLESDQSFRTENPSFLGRDTLQVQTLYRQHLENYHRLLAKAQEGDSAVSQCVELIQTDPKFKLLDFKQSQLNKLLPAVETATPPIDVTHLSSLVLKLNPLFGERESMLQKLKEDIKAFEIEDELRSRIEETNTTDESCYTKLVTHYETSFRARAADIESHIEEQKELMNLILAENEKFVMARRDERGAGCSSSDSCIAMLEDAIEEIDQLIIHLREGKDFYRVIAPRLEKIRNQIDELSTKLTVERLEYDDKEGRDRQEEADALMAKRLSQDIPTVAAAAANGVARGQPGWVDDEKVATLVAMDFDPDRVVDALKNQNNDVDAALNEMLSGS
jgi:hypothetical protein